MAEQAVHESAWVSAHAYYQDDLDRLLTRVVAPLADELAGDGLAHEFFFLRYWDGGPHLRLRVLPADDAVRAKVENLVRDRFGDYLIRYPAADRVSPPEYARLARSLAAWEGVPSYVESPYPNNSVRLIPYRREHDRYGDGAAIQAVEGHFAESSRIALRVVTMGATAEQRATAGTALILLTWFIGDVGPGRVLTTTGVPEADVERLSGQVTGLARRMRALVAHAGTLSANGTLIDWARSITALRDVLTPLDLAGGVATVLDVCAHLMCNRLGLSVAVEGAVRNLAARALGELAGEGN